MIATTTASILPVLVGVCALVGATGILALAGLMSPRDTGEVIDEPVMD